jgi:hypothetical protein
VKRLEGEKAHGWKREKWERVSVEKRKSGKVER